MKDQIEMNGDEPKSYAEQVRWIFGAMACADPDDDSVAYQIRFSAKEWASYAIDTFTGELLSKALKMSEAMAVFANSLAGERTAAADDAAEKAKKRGGQE